MVLLPGLATLGRIADSSQVNPRLLLLRVRGQAPDLNEGLKTEPSSNGTKVMNSAIMRPKNIVEGLVSEVKDKNEERD